MSGPRRALAGVALALGVGALLVGSPTGTVDGDVAALAREIGSPEARLDPLALARWIRDRRPALVVWDLRDPEAYESFHVPGAVRVEPAELPAIDLPHGSTVVVYGADGVPGAEARLVIRARGHDDVLFLDGGMLGWLDRVMMPVVPIDPPAEEAAAWDAVRELTEYFGGRAHREGEHGSAWRIRAGGPMDPSAAVGAVIEAARRRGCGW